jgi:hypothetical protein
MEAGQILAVAFDIVAGSKAQEAFDLSEPAKIVALWHSTGCARLARRLVERGARLTID